MVKIHEGNYFPEDFNVNSHEKGIKIEKNTILTKMLNLFTDYTVEIRGEKGDPILLNKQDAIHYLEAKHKGKLKNHFQDIDHSNAWIARVLDDIKNHLEENKAPSIEDKEKLSPLVIPAKDSRIREGRFFINGYQEGERGVKVEKNSLFTKFLNLFFDYTHEVDGQHGKKIQLNVKSAKQHRKKRMEEKTQNRFNQSVTNPEISKKDNIEKNKDKSG